MPFIVQGPFAQITWYHYIALLEKAATQSDRLWYARQAVLSGCWVFTWERCIPAVCRSRERGCGSADMLSNTRIARPDGQRLSGECGAEMRSPSGVIPFRNLKRSLPVDRTRVVFSPMMDL